MIDNVLWILVTWGCATLFFGIGIYAGKSKKPICFWSGTTVPAEEISDIPAYNQANRTMWILYSIPYWISGIVVFRFPNTAAVLIVAACSVGLIWLIRHYKMIERKYRNK